MGRTALRQISCVWVALASAAVNAAGLPVRAAEPSVSAAAQAAQDEMEVLRSERRVNAQPLSLIAPHYSIAGHDEADLVLLNTFSDPMQAALTAVGAGGEETPLGSFTVEPTQHLALSVRELAGNASAPRTGSLRLDFQGDFDMLQAWAVLRRGSDVLEIPLVGIGKLQALEVASFWDVREVRASQRAEPLYYLVNGGPRALTVTAEVLPGHGKGQAREVRELLPPGGRAVLAPLGLSPSLRSGSVRFTHDGPPGALAVSGVLAGDSSLAALPVSASIDRSLPAEWHAVRLPVPVPAPGLPAGRPVLVLYNASGMAQRSEVAILDGQSGTVLAARARHLPAGEVTSLVLDGASLPESGARVRVRGERSLQVYGFVEQPGGEVTDLAFFPRSDAHQNGSYPLLPLAEAEVFTTFVNLGGETAEIAAQISWQGGTYALRPFAVAPGASRRLDVAALAEARVPDMLGRTLDPEYRHGFLQWSARRGSHELIARTEARPGGGRDSFGFNCFGCCPENSFGDLVPGGVNFDVGVSVTFEAGEFIQTCNGVLGPYPALVTGLTYAAPLTWNGVTTTSSGLTAQTVRFRAEGEKTEITSCVQFPKEITDSGPVTVDKCQAQNAPGIDPTKACHQQRPTCEGCHDCCEANKKAAYCRCDKTGSGIAICKEGVDLATIKCREQCLGNVCL